MFKTVFKTVFLHPKSALSRLKHTIVPQENGVNKYEHYNCRPLTIINNYNYNWKFSGYLYTHDRRRNITKKTTCVGMQHTFSGRQTRKQLGVNNYEHYTRHYQ